MNKLLQKHIQEHLSQAQQEELKDFILALDNGLSKKEESQKKLPGSEQLFSIINNIREVIFHTDTKGKISYISPAWKDITGFEIEDTLGKHFFNFIHPEDEKKAEKLFKTIKEVQKKTDVVVVRCKTTNNQYKFLEILITLIFDDKNQIAGASGTLHDISDRVKAEQTIYKSEQKFRLFFENSSDPHMLFDKNGLVECNNATLDLLAADSKEQILNQNLSALAPEFQPDGMRSSEKALMMDELARQNGFHRFDWIHQSFEGKLIPVEVSLTYMRLESEPMILSVWHDLTERKNFEKQLIAAKEQAESASSAKARFLSTMSHEIRTPMNAVIGITHLLLEDNPKKTQIPNLKTLQFSAENLLVLINDILDFSKIEAGKIELENIDFSLFELLNSVRHSLAYKTQEKGLKLLIRKDEMLPNFIKGDPTRLAQVLTNLMSNAVKFTEKGSVTIDIDVASETAQKIAINFTVSDTGIGISKNKIDIIFDSFSQANTKITRKYGGTGLGLSITKRLLEIQGSEIHVESKEGKGTSFYFKLEFDKSFHQKSKPVSDIENNLPFISLKGTKVLIVEDNAINVLVASQFLKKWDVAYEVAENGQIAIEKVQEQNFDIVLMDLQMPVMDGYEATKAIRAMGGKMETLPIIAITASVMMQVRDEVLNAGMDDYISKPFNPNDFYKKIKRFVH